MAHLSKERGIALCQQTRQGAHDSSDAACEKGSVYNQEAPAGHKQKGSPKV